MMIDVVHRAIVAASENYSPEEWFSMLPGHRTEAIYREMRRLDAETLTHPVKSEQPSKE